MNLNHLNSEKRRSIAQFKRELAAKYHERGDLNLAEKLCKEAREIEATLSPIT